MVSKVACECWIKSGVEGRGYMAPTVAVAENFHGLVEETCE